MRVIVRIFGFVLATSCAGAGMGVVFLSGPYSDYIIPAFLLGCIGAIVGAIAGAAFEIVRALGQHRAG